MAYYQSNYPSYGGYGYNSGPPPPPNPYAGGYTVGYGGFQQRPSFPPQHYGGYGGYHQMHQPMHMPPMHRMPPSTSTTVVNMNIWTKDDAYMRAAENMVRVEDDEEEEEEEETQEDLGEEVVRSRKKSKRQMKRKAKIAKMVAAKIQEDESGSFMEELRQRYIANLKYHLDLDGTLEPTFGTVKVFKEYTADDPVAKYMMEKEETDIAGKKWDPEFDCAYLKQAFRGAGTDEDAVIHVVASRCNAQRQELKTMFKTMYGQDLIDDINSELSGNFEEAVMALFVPPAVFDAWCVKEAIYGLGTDESVLIEVLGTRTNAQVKAMRASYVDVASPHKKAGEGLIEEDIENDTSGDFKKFLISASQGNRRTLDPEKLDAAVKPKMMKDPETEEEMPTGEFMINFDELVDVEKAVREAKKLYEATEDRLGTDEEMMIRIFAVPETYQMRRTYAEYVKICQRDIENTIDRETSGDFGKSLLTLVQSLKCRPKYFAERLKQAMKGLGTADRDLIRVIVTRSEIDMVQIKECFLELTKQTLWNWLDQDCSGDYKKILQAVVGRD